MLILKRHPATLSVNSFVFQVAMPGIGASSWRLGNVKLERQESTNIKFNNRVLKIHRDVEDREIDLNVAYVEEADSCTSSTSSGREGQTRSVTEEVHYKGSCQDVETNYRGVRHRPELNKWVTEIRPTAQKRKIWLGTYKTPEEAARAYDVGIFYTGKKIPLNFPELVPILPALPGGSWEENAPFVKKQAVSAAKRARIDQSSRIMGTPIASRG